MNTMKEAINWYLKLAFAFSNQTIFFAESMGFKVKLFHKTGAEEHIAPAVVTQRLLNQNILSIDKLFVRFAPKSPLRVIATSGRRADANR